MAADATAPPTPGRSVGDLPPGLPLRRWLYAHLLDERLHDNLRRRIDRVLTWLILANLLALLAEHVPALARPWQHWLQLFDHCSVAVFAAEFLLRLYLAPEDPALASHRFARLRYLRSFNALVDLVAIAPSLVALMWPNPADLKFLRVLRLLRAARLLRLLATAWAEFLVLNQGRSVRQHVHALVSPSPHGGLLHHLFDLTILGWVLLSATAVVLESVESLHRELAFEFAVLDAIAVAIFSVEYLLRLYACVEEPAYRRGFAGRLRFASRPAALIDLLAIVPFLVEALAHHLVDLRFLRVFRLLRLLKLTRYSAATRTLVSALHREWPVIAASAFIMTLLVLMAASLGYLFEHEAQPDKFENIPQAIYWSVITLASVGYGDITPVTPAGRVVTVVLALLGIGIFAVPAAVLSSAFNEQLRSDRDALQNELYTMLEDGQISAEEQAAIDREAVRLHLSASEVERIMVRARQQRAQQDRPPPGLDLALLQGRPLLAFEQYRILVSQLRQVTALADPGLMQAQLRLAGSCTDLERRIWQQLQGDAAGQADLAAIEGDQSGSGRLASSAGSIADEASPDRLACAQASS